MLMLMLMLAHLLMLFSLFSCSHSHLVSWCSFSLISSLYRARLDADLKTMGTMAENDLFDDARCDAAGDRE